MLEPSLVSRVLDTALRTGGEFAEVFVEDARSSSARLDDGKVEELTSGRSRGAGIRVVVRRDDRVRPHRRPLRAGACWPRPRRRRPSPAVRPGAATVTAGGPAAGPTPTPVGCCPEDVPKAAKVELLAPGRRRGPGARAGRSARSRATYADSRRRILVANSDGLLAGDDQVKTRFAVQAVASGDTGMQTGRESQGFSDRVRALRQTSTSRRPVGRPRRRALTKLGARPAPSGHDAGRDQAAAAAGCCSTRRAGTASRPTWSASGRSVFAGRRGEQVASPLVTLVDDGTMGGEWGAFADRRRGASGGPQRPDRGRRPHRLHVGLPAGPQGGPAGSSNGRRQSYQHLPMVRMTNTFLVNGTEDPEEIIRQTRHGVYVAQLGGGQVNTATGDFVFGMTEAYLIEDGEITEPLRDANLIGNGPEVLTLIDVVGNDFAMGPPGTCGKDGQGVPVGDGQPTLRGPRP